MRRAMRAALLAHLAVAPPAAAQGARLVSTDSLARWLARDSLLLVDLRSDPFAYLADHLPGAVYLNVETLRATRGGVPLQLLEADDYRRLFRRLGIRLDRPVVLYSAGETRNMDATFVAWILEGFGHPQVHLLDGGYYKWQLEQRPLERRYPPARPAPGWERRPFRPAVATLEETRRASATGEAVLVDARPPEQFRGEAGAQRRRGHIPGAINRYWQDDLHTEGFGRVFRPVEELRREYAALGITPDRPVIGYCNSTTEVSHVYFTLKFLLGFRDVRLYAGSWTEWAGRDDLPVATGAR